MFTFIFQYSTTGTCVQKFLHLFCSFFINYQCFASCFSSSVRLSINSSLAFFTKVLDWCK